jgi:transposase-like protein
VSPDIYAKDGILVVLGVTITGDKVVLDIEHSHTENSLIINQLFDRLIKRGLEFED